MRTGAGKDEKASLMKLWVMAGHLADRCGQVRTGAGKDEKASHMMVSVMAGHLADRCGQERARMRRHL